MRVQFPPSASRDYNIRKFPALSGSSARTFRPGQAVVKTRLMPPAACAHATAFARPPCDGGLVLFIHEEHELGTRMARMENRRLDPNCIGARPYSGLSYSCT